MQEKKITTDGLFQESFSDESAELSGNIELFWEDSSDESIELYSNVHKHYDEKQGENNKKPDSEESLDEFTNRLLGEEDSLSKSFDYGNERMPLLHFNVKKGNRAGFYRLMAHENINIDVQCDQGNTALHIALDPEKSSFHFIRCLSEKGANLFIKNQEGINCLDMMVDLQSSEMPITSYMVIDSLETQKEVCKYLLQKGDKSSIDFLDCFLGKMDVTGRTEENFNFSCELLQMASDTEHFRRLAKNFYFFQGIQSNNFQETLVEICSKDPDDLKKFKHLLDTNQLSIEGFNENDFLTRVIEKSFFQSNYSVYEEIRNHWESFNDLSLKEISPVFELDLQDLQRVYQVMSFFSIGSTLYRSDTFALEVSGLLLAAKKEKWDQDDRNDDYLDLIVPNEKRDSFLEKLYQMVQEQIPININFVVTGIHWVCYRFSFSEGALPTLLIMDSSGNYGRDYPDKAEALAEKFNGEIVVYYADQGRQARNEGCKFFAMDDLFHLNNVGAYVSDQNVLFKCLTNSFESENPNGYVEGVNHLPLRFLRSIEIPFSRLENLVKGDSDLDVPLNRRQLTFFESIKPYYREDVSTGKVFNYWLDDKIERMQLLVLNYLESFVETNEFVWESIKGKSKDFIFEENIPLTQKESLSQTKSYT